VCDAFDDWYGTNLARFHVYSRRSPECDELLEKHDEHHTLGFILFRKIPIMDETRRGRLVSLDKQHVTSPSCDR
jgi:hypothetical protein